MVDFIFNNVLGKERVYTDLPNANDALIVVPLLAANLEADATLRDYTSLSALLAGSSDEHPMGRKVFSAPAGATVVDMANDRVRVPFANADWAGPSGGAVGALLVCYDPDTTTGDDSTVVPLTKHDFQVDGLDGTGNITARVAVEGLLELRGI